VKNNIAVVGSIDSILAFKTVGFDVFGVTNEENTRSVLNKVLTQYKLIMITDNYAIYVEDIIKDTQNSAYPTVLIIPSGVNSGDYALKQISESVERALGVNILLNKENE
jgi:V/A-type H+-transporting ATPase subunit F